MNILLSMNGVVLETECVWLERDQLNVSVWLERDQLCTVSTSRHSSLLAWTVSLTPKRYWPDFLAPRYRFTTSAFKKIIGHIPVYWCQSFFSCFFSSHKVFTIPQKHGLLVHPWKQWLWQQCEARTTALTPDQKGFIPVQQNMILSISVMKITSEMLV